MSEDNQNLPTPDQQFVHEHDELKDETLQVIHSQLIREKSEPSERRKPISVFVVFIVASFFFWGGYYIGNYSAEFRSDIFDETWRPGGSSLTAEPPFDPIAKGSKLFARQCQQCHQADGNGLPGVYPPIHQSPWLLNSDHRPIKILLKGLSGPIEVLGHSYNGNMPAIADWKDRDIAAVLTFVRQHWDNKASPISEELVKQIREQIKDRTKPWTAEELLKEDPL